MDKNQYIKPRVYELLAILLPDQGDEATTAAIDTMLGHITGQNATIDSVNADSPWGRRRLAYTIRHEGVDYRDGHYVLIYFTSMPGAISEIERDLKLDTNIIRYLLLTHDPEMGEKVEVSEEVEVEDNAEAEESTATEDTASDEIAETSAADDAVEADEAVDEVTEEAVAEEEA